MPLLVLFAIIRKPDILKLLPGQLPTIINWPPKPGWPTFPLQQLQAPWPVGLGHAASGAN